MNLELVCVYNSGWVNDKLSEEVVCTSEIVVPDVLSIKSNSTLIMDLPFKYTESKRKQIMKGFNVVSDQDMDPVVRIKIKNLSSVKTNFAPPYDDYVEGVKMDPETYSKQLLKLGLSRQRRILAFLKLCLRAAEELIYWKYPVFSLISLVVNIISFSFKIDW
jgi:hypothetical protein